MELKYQENYSLLHGSRTLDKVKRIRKAKQIELIIKHYAEKNNNLDNLKKFDVLNIGCSIGEIDKYLSPNFKSILGIDIDEYAINYANKYNSGQNISYRLANIDNFDKKNSFDLIICNSVLEHVPDQRKLMHAIYKLLKNNGFCFLSVPNKYTPLKEPHYDIYFLSWLPKKLAKVYLTLLKKGTDYYENPLSYFKLKKLCKKFKIYDYTPLRIKCPQNFLLEWRLSSENLLTKLPIYVLELLSFFSPSFVFVLEKNDK